VEQMCGLKVTEDENIRNIVFFAHVFVKSGLIYVKPRPRLVRSTHIVELHFISGNALFL